MRRLTLLLIPAALVAAQARYARLGELAGTVEVQLTAADDWMSSARNLPLPESTRVRTGASSRVEIELDQGSAWRMGADSQCEISDYSRLSTGQRITMLSLDRGLAYFTGQAYLDAWTTFAALEADAAVIDPAGFTARPKEPLRSATFVTALPSPALFASRLDAVRPLRNAMRQRVLPLVDGVTFVSNASPSMVVVNPPPAPAPVLVVTEPAADPPPPEVVPYPVPVYTGIVIRERDRRSHAAATGAPAIPAAKGTNLAGAAPSTSPRPREARVPAGGREKKFRDSREERLASVAIAEVNGGSYAKAIASLDLWSHRYPSSDFQDDRRYYYIIAFDGVRQPVKVVDSARLLLVSPADIAFQDPRQMILACYLTAKNLQKLAHVTAVQHATGGAAARSLREAVEAYFRPENRPAETSSSEWAKARNELETTARDTLSWLNTHRGLPD